MHQTLVPVLHLFVEAMVIQDRPRSWCAYVMLSGSGRRAPHSVLMSLVQGGEGTAPEECGGKDRERRRKASTAGIGEGKWSKEGRRLRAGMDDVRCGEGDGYGVLGQSDEKEERVRIVLVRINLVRICKSNEGQGR